VSLRRATFTFLLFFSLFVFQFFFLFLAVRARRRRSRSTSTSVLFFSCLRSTGSAREARLSPPPLLLFLLRFRTHFFFPAGRRSTASSPFFFFSFQEQEADRAPLLPPFLFFSFFRFLFSALFFLLLRDRAEWKKEEQHSPFSPEPRTEEPVLLFPFSFRFLLACFSFLKWRRNSRRCRSSLLPGQAGTGGLSRFHLFFQFFTWAFFFLWADKRDTSVSRRKLALLFAKQKVTFYSFFFRLFEKFFLSHTQQRMVGPPGSFCHEGWQGRPPSPLLLSRLSSTCVFPLSLPCRRG